MTDYPFIVRAIDALSRVATRQVVLRVVEANPIDNIVSLLHCEGPNGSTALGDETGRIWTAYGNAKLTTAESKWGGSAIELSGTSGGYFDSPNPALNGDFTIAFWIKPKAYSSTVQGVIYNGSPTSNSHRVQIQISNGRISNWRESAGGNSAGSTTQLPLTAWSHVECFRHGNQIGVFINGVLEGQVTNNDNLNVTGPLQIGRCRNGGSLRYLNAFLDDILIVKGVALHTSNFAVPTGPYSYGG